MRARRTSACERVRRGLAEDLRVDRVVARVDRPRAVLAERGRRRRGARPERHRRDRVAERARLRQELERGGRGTVGPDLRVDPDRRHLRSPSPRPGGRRCGLRRRRRWTISPAPFSRRLRRRATTRWVGATSAAESPRSASDSCSTGLVFAAMMPFSVGYRGSVAAAGHGHERRERGTRPRRSRPRSGARPGARRPRPRPCARTSALGHAEELGDGHRQRAGVAVGGLDAGEHQVEGRARRPRRRAPARWRARRRRAAPGRSRARPRGRPSRAPLRIAAIATSGPIETSVTSPPCASTSWRPASTAYSSPGSSAPVDALAARAGGPRRASACPAGSGTYFTSTTTFMGTPSRIDSARGYPAAVPAPATP